jgi:hypothetical protein
MRPGDGGNHVDNRSQTEYNPRNVIRLPGPIRTASRCRIRREG